MPVTRHVIEEELDRFYKIFLKNICVKIFKLKFVGTLDPRKLIELKINRMNIFHMKISQITIDIYTVSVEIIKADKRDCNSSIFPL